jgi:hypothetical protein
MFEIRPGQRARDHRRKSLQTAFYEDPDGLNFVSQHCWGESWVGSEEEGLIHDSIGTRQGRRRTGNGGLELGLNLGRGQRATIYCNHPDSRRSVLAELDEYGLTKQVTAEEHAVTNLVLVEMTTKV